MEEKNIMTFKDENGNERKYELLDIIPVEGKIYTVFYPTVLNDTEIIILRVEESDNPEESKYIVEQDKQILNKVYVIFKEKYKNEIDFID